MAAKPLPPGLYLVATPIGNLSDITLRALSILASADIVLAEDTRHSAKLLNHYAIKTKLRPYHEHNAERERPAILANLKANMSVALISDAGTPLVSDPGFKLVRDCADAGHMVTSLPGPSAPLAALLPSGLPTDTFVFAGFLPSKNKARQARISELAAIPATLVLFEAPSRLPATLGDLAALLGDRPAAVARELTKLNEEFARGTLGELALDFAARESIKGEIVIVVAPPEEQAATDEQVEQRLSEALQDMSLRDAAKTVAQELSIPRNRAYELGLALKRTTRNAD
ncbi:MAG: 16S rRNA (cytidine(1402)-2'-O)-methyltransferase [Alphaproteobacteria bacterium]|nr:16S rRNA (cytidine(1402)-2'-O)-methyltransferase [Alphaproteobacteria bacterium]